MGLQRLGVSIDDDRIMIDGSAFRGPRRMVTAPPEVLRGEDLQDFAVIDLRPPDTTEVRRHIAMGGPSITLRDVALGIARRLLESPENDPAEMLFLAECLKAGSAKTAMPCALLQRDQDAPTEDEIQSYLLRTYGRGDDTPCSTVSHAALSVRSSFASRRPSRRPSFAMSEAAMSEELRFPGVLSGEDRAAVEKHLEANFDTWSMDVFELSTLTGGRALQVAGWEALRRGGMFSEFSIAPEQARRFLQRVEAKYARAENVPYHNSLHAADVTQSVHALLWQVGFGEYFEPLSVLALILGAVAHDIGHDGRNNAFHVNVQDQLALTYNDRSVLENFHVSEAFKVMAKEADAQILASLDKEQFVRIRKDMIEGILGTDMAHHFRQVESFKNHVEKLDRDPEDWFADPQALSCMQAMVLHAVDISNPGKPTELSDRWIHLLREEFCAQGDEEKARGLPVSPLCDRNSTKFAGPQVGFMEFVVKPTWSLLSDVLPSVGDVVGKVIDHNLAVWGERKMLEEKAANQDAAEELTDSPSDGTSLGDQTP